MGARNVLVKHERGVFAHLRREKERGRPLRFRVEAPRGRDRLAGRCRVGAARRASSPRGSSTLPPDEALRRAVAAGTASTLVVGSGQFELREAGRLVHDVSVAELASVAAEPLTAKSRYPGRPASW